MLTPSPVALRAEELGLRVVKTNVLDERVTHGIAQLRPELGVIVAYGAFVREPLLSIPKHGWLNLHFSTLPKWRGAAPVQRALIAGERQLGLTVFRLDTGMDSGPILATAEHTFPLVTSSGQVLTRLSISGAALLAEAVAAVADGSAVFRAQDGEPSFAPKLSRDDGHLVWDVPRDTLINRWAGVTPEPGAFAMVEGNPVKILELDVFEVANHNDDMRPLAAGEASLGSDGVAVGTATAPVCLRRVQPAGKGAMDARDWLRGRGGSARLQ